MMQLRQFENLRDGELDVPWVRRAVADIVLFELLAIQATPKRWNKVHFAHAISALGLNIRRVEPTQAWLELALMDLTEAMQATQPAEVYSEGDIQRDMVTLEEMITTVEALRDDLRTAEAEAGLLKS
jgi:hypothetical protein